jgi:hypothetical protein
MSGTHSKLWGTKAKRKKRRDCFAASKTPRLAMTSLEAGPVRFALTMGGNADTDEVGAMIQ